ncbi:undecaprenyldiphospho-muramoylpentapeptide beta-N- acetylglucosaminyltransferase [Nitritalea halalkaliphila LW7]|uniref:Undecaprenyldiphospho-muramoylpentapeptide beta-N-acetylglucosaminyltransferase n=1 Tax=Nitritalea halalkaliphila LW7 TaxID=1189621 RepID=I5C2D6_9BACT|nr:undecaprenyldiphospho-muramoylpentapeptide beta-N- acetylglucosaminyltransferase [Nitritalea halalkaliphila LW7]
MEQRKGPYRLIISGGGTGGHIYPALAVAKAWVARYPDSRVLFVGAEGKMEMEQVPKRVLKS